MKGLDKLKAEIQTEVELVKDSKKKKYYKQMMDKCIEHIEEVCDDEYDDLLAQKHKSFKRMWIFVINKAKEMAINGVAFVDDPDVFGWIDEYVGLDDKKEVEEEEKKAKESSKKLDNVKAKALSKTKTFAKKSAF
jgi:hypothetical protein